MELSVSGERLIALIYFKPTLILAAVSLSRQIIKVGKLCPNISLRKHGPCRRCYHFNFYSCHAHDLPSLHLTAHGDI